MLKIRYIVLLAITNRYSQFSIVTSRSISIKNQLKKKKTIILSGRKIIPSKRKIFQYFFYKAGLLIFLRNRQVNLSKWQSNSGQKSQNPSLNHLIDPSFKGVKGLFIINLQPHREKKGESGTPDQPNL